jgi:hypothetical protein
VLIEPESDGDSEPIIVRNCRFSVGYDAVYIDSKVSPEGRPANVLVIDNRIDQALRGICVNGSARGVLIAGNIVVRCAQAGIQLAETGAIADQIVIANNTIGSQTFHGLRQWEEPTYDPLGEGQVQVINNLIFDCQHSDITYVLGGSEVAVGDFAELRRAWQLHHNARDRVGTGGAFIMPEGDDEFLFQTSLVTSLNPDRADFLQPVADSPLASSGAGTADPSFPTYIGAVPPEGTARWDWLAMWKGRR